MCVHPHSVTLHFSALCSISLISPSPICRDGRSGFTLIELLLVIGIIAVLSSIVIAAVNPRQQLGDARDAERRHNAKELRNAQIQYLIDQGRFAADQTIPTGITSALPICRARQNDNNCVSVDALVPTYIACIPYDGAEANTLRTGYRIYQQNSQIQIESMYIGSGAVAGGCEVPRQPIAYWKFDETGIGANAADSSGNGFTATANGFGSPYGPSTTLPTVTFSDPRSLRFDASNDYLTVTTTSLLNLSSIFTFTAWIYIVSPLTDDREILMRSDGSGQNELSFAVEDTGVLAVHIDGTRYESINDVPLDQWVHVAGARNGATIKIYINGSVDATRSPGSKRTNFNSCNTLHIGTDVDSGCTGIFGNHWKGWLDDVRIYNVALSDAEIALLAAGNP